jgi:beta-lactam-binding protein with PASTA domain
MANNYQLPKTNVDILCMTPMKPTKFVQMQITQAIQYLRSQGVPVYEQTTEYDPEYPRLLWSQCTQEISQSRSEGNNVKTVDSIAEFVALFEVPEKPKVFRVENISQDYNAVVTKDAIAVGCQTIPAEKFKELIKAAKAVGMIR